MALLTKDAVHDSLDNLFINSGETNEAIADLENQVDVYEDRLGSYLVRIAGEKLSQSDSRTMSKILHSIGNFERISDHALNLVKSAEEISQKKIEMSESAIKELEVLGKAVNEIMDLTVRAYKEMDISEASKIEPLEQVIDMLVESIRQNHIVRLQKGHCTIEKGFCP